jgi:thioredoxin reductase
MSGDVDLLVVGAGPAGLAAATALAERGRRVVVIDREPTLGGIPRHCFHTGFGWFDLRRILSGPAYAARRVELARKAGAELRSETTALEWTGPCALRLTSPRGVEEVSARAVLLATGCRERPRAARLVPGARPAGVFTTGSLQQLVYLQRRHPGRRAVVVGAEHVSFSAVHTLLGSGTKVAAVVTDLPCVQTYAALRMAITGIRGIPVMLSSEVTRIDGRRRVERVVVSDRLTGATTEIECDTVVFTGDWIPDHELARAGALTIDARTRGPAVDQQLRTSRAGVFAAGNLLRGAEMADVAALEGRSAAASIDGFLHDGAWRTAPLPIELAEPLLWISPSLVEPGAGRPPRDRFVLRTRTLVPRGAVAVKQDDQLLGRYRLGRMVPNRWLRLPVDWVERVTPGAGPITMEIV